MWVVLLVISQQMLILQYPATCGVGFLLQMEINKMSWREGLVDVFPEKQIILFKETYSWMTAWQLYM